MNKYLTKALFNFLYTVVGNRDDFQYYAGIQTISYCKYPAKVLFHEFEQSRNIDKYNTFNINSIDISIINKRHSVHFNPFKVLKASRYRSDVFTKDSQATLYCKLFLEGEILKRLVERRLIERPEFVYAAMYIPQSTYACEGCSNKATYTELRFSLHIPILLAATGRN